MSKIIAFAGSVACCFLAMYLSAQQTGTDRKLWLSHLDKMARPVMSNLAAGTLKANMPVELTKSVDNAATRRSVSYLEALGRTFSGIAPWLNLEGGDPAETRLRNEYRSWSLKAIANAVNPSSKDFMKWTGGQPLVDASFLALGLTRCPWVWQNLDTAVKQQVITAFLDTRSTVPVYSNWILFSGMIEAFFCKYDLPYDPVRIEYAVREFANHWYVGDGMFSDGMQFHVDYYNSIVIHPYLAEIVAIMSGKKNDFTWFVPQLTSINKRYAEIQERSINSDGSYPIIGRSIVYRGGVFHHLANTSLKKQLPATLQPAQVRSALTAVIQKTIGPGAYDQKGWLTIGLTSSQPALAEFYITTGSLYIAATIFLPLGLPATDPFWSEPALPWTSVKVWSGQDVPADHAMELH